MKSCDLCRLPVIEKEFFRNDEFIVMSCMSCKIPMVVPFEHIDPKDRSHKELRKRMEEELLRVAKKFYGKKKFFIDKQENKIPHHMHWHAREVKLKNLPRYLRTFLKQR